MKNMKLTRDFIMKKRISTLKIKQLLSMSFGILLVILLLLGLTSITYIHNISGNTEVLYERPHTNLVGMWEAKSRISQTGNGLREMSFTISRLQRILPLT